MIKAVMYDEIATLEVHGASTEEFQADLKRIKSIIPPWDREWDPELKRWKVKNPEKYNKIKALKAAIEDRKRQPLLL